MRRLVEGLALAVACATQLLLPSAVAAQTLQADTTGWHFSITPYAWLSGLSGRVGVRSVATNVDLEPVDVAGMLRFGAMASAEARHGRWLVLADGVYASLGNGTVLAFRGDTGTFTLGQKEAIVQPTAGYTFGENSFAIDALVGARYWYLGATLDVDRTRRPTTVERSDSREWVDATGGARLRWQPTSVMRIVAGADGGAGGARSTWQAYGSVETDAWNKVTVGFGYRVLAVDYDRRNFLFDTRTSGITLGAKFHF